MARKDFQYGLPGGRAYYRGKDAYAAQSFENETRQKLEGAVATANAGTFPPGMVMPFAGATTPDGWLLCDGSAVSRIAYAALFSSLGGTWGTGDGSSTFNVPDLRGRAIIGAGTGSGLTARTRGTQNIGEETHVLLTVELASHTHAVGTLVNATESSHTHGVGSFVNVAEAAHTHPVGLVSDGSVVGGNIQLGSSGNTYHFGASGTGNGSSGAGTSHNHTISGTSAAGSAHTHTIGGSSASAGSDTAHNNMQPSAVCTWIIKT